MAVAGRGLADQLGDGGGHVGATAHRETASLAEVVLHVYDDQGAAHGRCPSTLEVSDGGALDGGVFEGGAAGLGAEEPSPVR
ncbi:hypothetical protein GCM10023220_63540 [Streptomyces ziwulingensis]|uniref:Uncharacterized protein n=1 Tax=Streptomyces ziwulingensis TaxID=1045501 RepID=A0ABP9CXX8_9ACTN